MVDQMNPTTQFHPYQPSTATPVAEKNETPTTQLMKKIGLDPSTVNIGDSVNKVRDYARKNPGLVLGGLSALIIAAGLLSKRRKTTKVPTTRVPA